MKITPKTMWLGFAVGWLLTVLVALMYPSRQQWIIAALAVSTLFLVCRRDFPRRKQGIAFSGIGPLAIAVWLPIAAKRSLAPASDVIDPHTAAMQIAEPLLTGAIFLAVMGAWLFRGYGLIPLSAMAATLWRRQRKTFEQLATEYPWRFWWITVLGLTVVGALLPWAVVYLLTRHAVASFP